jgi:hypothetical protein
MAIRLVMKAMTLVKHIQFLIQNCKYIQIFNLYSNSHLQPHSNCHASRVCMGIESHEIELM